MVIFHSYVSLPEGTQIIKHETILEWKPLVTWRSPSLRNLQPWKPLRSLWLAMFGTPIKVIQCIYK